MVDSPWGRKDLDTTERLQFTSSHGKGVKEPCPPGIHSLKRRKAARQRKPNVASPPHAHVPRGSGRVMWWGWESGRAPEEIFKLSLESQVVLSQDDAG